MVGGTFNGPTPQGEAPFIGNHAGGCGPGRSPMRWPSPWTRNHAPSKRPAFLQKGPKGLQGTGPSRKKGKGNPGTDEPIGNRPSGACPALRGVDKKSKKPSKDLFPVKKEPAKPKKEKEEKIPTPNIIRTKLSKQFELCAGTSAAANEYVTFQLAQPEDLWFHVRDLPGSHVILRRLQRDSTITDEMILQAAKVAASQSKAQPGTKVTVSYTEKKNVKRRFPRRP